MSNAAPSATATPPPLLGNLASLKAADVAEHGQRDAVRSRDTLNSVTLVSPRDTYRITVPEDEPLQEDTVFASSSAQAASVAALAAHQQQRHQKQKLFGGLGALLTCTCLKGPAVSDQEAAHAAAPGAETTLQLGQSGSVDTRGNLGAPITSGGTMSRKVSQRTSSTRKWVSLKRMGSSAYSDAEWFDATSTWGGNEEQQRMLAEVESLVKELGELKGPWIPDTPLIFAAPNMQFVPVPAHTGLAGWWERDDDRTTPPPQPIDVMLKLNWIVQKSHNSVPGVYMEETDTELTVTVKPRFMPPGLPRYQEFYDKTNETEKSWTLRRDLKAGRSFGRMFYTADGTVVFRVRARPLLSNDFDVITEEYMRFEEEGKVLVVRQCCLDISSGNRAVQYLVGRLWDTPPKGSI